MKKLALLLLTFTFIATLLGCTSANVQPTYAANGANGYQISCGGIFGGGDISACYLAAGKTCMDKGYSTTHTGVSSIIISCKNPEESTSPVEATKK